MWPFGSNSAPKNGLFESKLFVTPILKPYKGLLSVQLTELEQSLWWQETNCGRLSAVELGGNLGLHATLHPIMAAGEEESTLQNTRW